MSTAQPAEADLDGILDWRSRSARVKPDCGGLRDWKRRLPPSRICHCAARWHVRIAGFEVRQLLYDRKPHLYRILFTTEDERVVILHIWHGRRGRPGSTH